MRPVAREVWGEAAAPKFLLSPPLKKSNKPF